MGKHRRRRCMNIHCMNIQRYTTKYFHIIISKNNGKKNYFPLTGEVKYESEDSNQLNCIHGTEHPRTCKGGYPYSEDKSNHRQSEKQLNEIPF